MGWHSEKQFADLTIGEQQIERAKIDKGYYSEYRDYVIKQRESNTYKVANMSNVKELKYWRYTCCKCSKVIEVNPASPDMQGFTQYHGKELICRKCKYGE